MSQRDVDGLTETQYLSQYRPSDFPRPSVTVDNVIFTVADVSGNNYRRLPDKELRVLLIKRAGHPYIGQWALPGGFVLPDETVGEAAKRELVEETGISVGHLEQLYTFSTPGRDPRTWVISCAHMALIDSVSVEVNAGSDASEARWFTVKMENLSGKQGMQLSLTEKTTELSAVVIPNEDGGELRVKENKGLAFDHAEIIACAITRLRAKLEYTDLAFCLLPEKFTLTQLQQVYETILGKKLYKAAFRRKIVNMVEKTEQYTSEKGHRPAIKYTRVK